MADNATTQANETAVTSAEQNTATTTEQNQQHGEGEQSKTGTERNEAIDKLIQSAVDRAVNKYANENKKLRGENEALKKAKLSDDELKQMEMQEKEKELAERDKAITDRENRLFAIKAIKDIGLDDGSDASLAIVDFVMAEDEDGIKERVKAFNALVERIVSAKVDGVFKQNGRTPGVGSNTSAESGGKNDSIAVRLGKDTANANKAAQTVLEHYIGGRK